MSNGVRSHAQQSNGVDFAALLRDVEDLLIPRLGLDAHERSLYYHFLRHSIVTGGRTVQYSMERLAAATGFSEFTVRDRTRSMHRKGCIKLIERGRTGTTVEVVLPTELAVCEQTAASQSVPDIEGVDYFRDAKGRAAIIARDGLTCSYCLRQVSADKIVLDHIQSQSDHGEHSYRNIVVACHECNSLKAGQHVNTFLRKLLRNNRLADSEFDERIKFIETTLRGERKPTFEE